MTESELLGRLEALAKYVLHLTAALEDSGHIDGPRFSAALRGADRPVDQVDSVRIARERLGSMAAVLDADRAARRQCGPR